MAQSEIINIDTRLPAEIVINAKGLTGLAQEVRTVMTTRKGSVPLDRDFGLDFTIIDQPVNTILPVYIGEAAAQIEKYVPRVQVVSIDFLPRPDEAAEGFLYPVAKVRIRKEYRHEFI